MGQNLDPVVEEPGNGERPDLLTLADLLDAAGGDRGHVTLEFESSLGRQSVTVGELVRRAQRVAGGLECLGLGAGDTVSAQLSHRPEAVVLQFAAVLIGATLAPIVPVFGARDVAAVLNDAKPKLFVTERSWGKFDYLAGLTQLEDALPEHVVVVGGADGHLDWEALEASEPVKAVRTPLPSSDRCLLIYTSGSTGVPKGVQHTLDSVFAEVLDLDYRAYRDSSRDVYLQGSGAGHIGGYMFPWRAIYYRMRTIVLDGWNAPRACRIVTDEGVTAMVTTPFHLVSMLEVAEADPTVDLSTIKLLMTGGAPVTPMLIRRAHDRGVTVVRAYGMSEHPTVAIGNRHDPLEVRAATDGYVTGRNEIRLLDDGGADVTPGAQGEVVLRGPEQFAGYTNVPREEAFTSDGWFRTGDIGRFDEAGRLVIVDRKKNLIIRGGENLSATEIEDIVARHPAVADVGVVGVPDERYGERACAFVVLHEQHTLTLSDLLAHFVSVGAAKQKVPEFLEVVSSLPRTGTGKLRKPELLALRRP